MSAASTWVSLDILIPEWADERWTCQLSHYVWQQHGDDQAM